MEHTKIEVAVLEKVVAEVNEHEVHQLAELQLALVGGGVGEVTPY